MDCKFGGFDVFVEVAVGCGLMVAVEGGSCVGVGVDSKVGSVVGGEVGVVMGAITEEAEAYQL